MANNYTQFSFVLKGVTAEEATWLQHEHASVEEYPDGCGPEFELAVDGPEAFFYAEENGNVEQAAALVSQFFEKFRPAETLVFEWADWCSKPRPGEFGGGVCLVSATGLVFESTSEAAKRLVRVGPEVLVLDGPIGSNDYTLADTNTGSSFWVSIKDLLVHVHVTDEGVVVDLHSERLDQDGNEEVSDEAIASTCAFFGEGTDPSDE
jgi:hypothetical protein